MPPNAPRDAIVIALDVGKSVSVLNDNEEETFFQSARNCVSWIIQRKIISQSVDVLSLLLIGSEDSDCSLVSSGCSYIYAKFDFQVASWDMLEFIEKDIKTSNVESDWLGALIISIEMLKAYKEFNKVSNKKIVIFSDFTKPITNDLSEVSRRIKALNIEVTIIGPEHLQFSAECDDDGEPEIKKKKFQKSLERQEGEKVAYQLWRELPENVGICTFESALKQLCSYAPKPKRVTPWHCMMDIGDVNINIALVKKTEPKQPKKFDTKFAKSGEDSSAEDNSGVSRHNAPTTRDLVMYYKHETEQGNEFVDVEVKRDGTVQGYRYGRTVVPFSEEDKAAMKYKTGEKCFSVIGFSRACRVPYYLLSGECSYVVVPRNKDKNAEVALSALIQALKQTKCLAFVRRVYSYNRGLSLGILYPIVEEIFSDETSDVTYREYLIFVEVAFEDDVKSVNFQSLASVAKNLTRQQYDAVDGLIDGMNLMTADTGLRGEACEAFDLSFLHDYKEQFFHYCVIQKGLYPEYPLPKSLPHYIENFIQVPKAVERKCEAAFRDIEAQFIIKKRLDGSSDIAISKEANVNLQPMQIDAKFVHFSESSINEEKNPIVRSWMRIFRQGFRTEDELDTLFDAYMDAGESEISLAFGFLALVISQIRTNCIKKDPDAYNEGMVVLKKCLSKKDELGSKIWKVIVKEHVGLIKNEENQNSSVSNEEAEKFLCMDINRACTSKKQMPNFQLLEELIEEQMNVDFDC